jgi:hypothetical protein
VRTGSSITISFAASAPYCLNFSAGPYPYLSLSATTFCVCYIDSMAGCPRIPWAMIVPSFQAPWVSHSLILGSLSRWCLDKAFQDKGSDRMSFFTKASLLHWSNHCLIESVHWV